MSEYASIKAWSHLTQLLLVIFFILGLLSTVRYLEWNAKLKFNKIQKTDNQVEKHPIRLIKLRLKTSSLICAAAVIALTTVRNHSGKTIDKKLSNNYNVPKFLFIFSLVLKLLQLQ